jgi:hypothetical protein
MIALTEPDLGLAEGENTCDSVTDKVSDCCATTAPNFRQFQSISTHARNLGLEVCGLRVL